MTDVIVVALSGAGLLAFGFSPMIENTHPRIAAWIDFSALPFVSAGVIVFMWGAW